MDTQNSQEQKLIIAFENIKRLTARPSSKEAISYREFMMMYVINNLMKRKKLSDEVEEQQGVMISRLSDLLQISRPTATQMVNSLEEKGYVVRTTSDTDRRVVYIGLTNKGEQIYDTQMATFSGILSEVTEKVGKKEIDQLIFLCDRFQEAVHEVRSRQFFTPSDEAPLVMDSV
ncbi:MarR family transcriptional regulator [Paenibacillus sp. FSL K6-0276]|uniref:MarR family winged helix-turn-helix transcriptional regulator n=1 Tax=Paenibacillus sp. FSL K6-0276 TaxID=2921450 RepID=UPI0030EED15E